MLIKQNIYNSLTSLSKKRKQKNIKKKNDFAIYLLYIFGAISYLFSLHKIGGVGMNCFRRKRVVCLYILVSLLFISSFFTSISLYLIIFKNNKKIHLFIIFIIYLIFYIIDHNDTIIKHGLYNFIAFLLSTIILFAIFCFFNLIHYFFKKRNFFNKYNHFSCDYWAKGLNNSYIDNLSKDYPCNIDFPQDHSCYLSEIGPFFDFSRIYKRTTCLDPDLINFEKEKYLRDTKNLKYRKKIFFNSNNFTL